MIQAVSRTSYYKIRRRIFFFLQVISRKKEEKSSTDELPSIRFAVEFFLSYESLKSRKRRNFLPTSYIQGQLKYRKPRKPLSPPGLVCCQKRGRWERKEKKRKEKYQGRWSVATKKGTWERKEKKRKRPRQMRRLLQRRQGFVCPTPRILFLVHEYLGLEAAHLGWSIGSYETWSRRKPCAKEVPETDYFTQQKQYLKRTTLFTYSAKAVPWKDYFTQVEDPAAKHCSKEGRTIALEQSVSKKAVFWQATINLYSRVWDPLVIPCLGCTA